MKKSIANKWIKALRSGKYKQTRHQLKDETGYCCLGVLCDISKLDKFKLDNLHINMYTYLGVEAILPIEVANWAGITGQDSSFTLPHLDKELPRYQLSALNDNGYTFEQIANIIETYWKYL